MTSSAGPWVQSEGGDAGPKVEANAIVGSTGVESVATDPKDRASTAPEGSILCHKELVSGLVYGCSCEQN